MWQYTRANTRKTVVNFVIYYAMRSIIKCVIIALACVCVCIGIHMSFGIGAMPFGSEANVLRSVPLCQYAALVFKSFGACLLSGI